MFGGLIAPASGPVADDVDYMPACTAEAESGYGWWDEMGSIETVNTIVAVVYVG